MQYPPVKKTLRANEPPQKRNLENRSTLGHRALETTENTHFLSYYHCHDIVRIMHRACDGQASGTDAFSVTC
jgi:hypothetical protein